MSRPEGPAPQSRAERRGIPASFRLGGWLVDPSCNRIVNGTSAVPVRPQLIDVLACLASRPGQVVSKSRLLSEVWGDRYVVDTGVARCVAELRRVLSDDARRPRVIETIPKRGYRLIARVEPAEAAPEATPEAGGTPPGDRAPDTQAPPVTPRCRAALVGWRVEAWSAARGFLAATAMLTEVARYLARKVVG